MQHFYNTYRKLLLYIVTGLGASVLAVILLCNQIVGADAKYILKSGENKHVRIGLVLGAGITNDGKPYKELQARLDVAADSLATGQVDKLILSGDNRFKQYNEPDAMKEYLMHSRHVPSDRLQTDYAGRSTYESCERAAKIFKAQEIIIFSAGSHLPRAIYLCRSFGIKAYGISSRVEANNSGRREVLARVKAIFNVYLLGEDTLLGPSISI